MKYLITESQIDNLIFMYLDNQDFIQIDDDNLIHFVNSEDDSNAQITFNKMNNECSITRGLNKEISSFFSLEDSNEVIGRWVENALQMNVSNATTSKAYLLPKFKTPKSRIDRVVFNYLDTQDFTRIEDGNIIYFVNSESNTHSRIKYDKNDGRCFLSFRLIREVSLFFSMEESKCEQIIGRWVEDTLQMKVTSVREGPIKMSRPAENK